MAATTGSKPKLGTMKESGFHNDNSSLQNNAVQLVLPMLQEAAASAAKAYLSAPGGAAGQAGASRRAPFWVLELGCSQVKGVEWW